jgi:hypothetical protein
VRPTRTPDAVLRASAETNVAACVRRILATFDAATPAMVAAGATWYPDAYGVCSSIAAGTHHDVDTVARVMAQLSPRTPWARNVAGTAHMFATDGARMPGILTANHERALGTLRKGDPLNGPKVRSFHANIMGDSEAVTIDVWAARTALGTTEAPTDTILDRAGVYGALSHAYRVAAAKRGVTPAAMQAITWVVARNGRAA